MVELTWAPILYYYHLCFRLSFPFFTLVRNYYAHTENGLNVGVEQLKAGLVRVYSKEKFSLRKQRLTLEAEAKQKRMGSWQ